MAAGEDFSGVGVLICDAPETLPIVPLRSKSMLPDAKDVVASLAAISILDSEYHDGFHIVSSDWQLIRISQYFSPPIVSNAFIDRSKLIGGGYEAELFGSAIPSVKLEMGREHV